MSCIHLLNQNVFHAKLPSLLTSCSALLSFWSWSVLIFIFLAQDFTYCCLPVCVLSISMTSSFLTSSYPHSHSLSQSPSLIADPVYPIATLSGIDSMQWLLLFSFLRTIEIWDGKGWWGHLVHSLCQCWIVSYSLILKLLIQLGFHLFF